MSLNSVNTNISAQVALQSLNSTNSQLQATQKRISTGFRVADATDDGAAFAVAQKVRADVGALTTVNQQLGSAKGLVGTAITALTSVSDSFKQAKSLLVQLGDASISDAQRAQYVTSFQGLVNRVAQAVDGSTYNGKSLLGVSGGTAAAANSGVKVISNETGTQTLLNNEDNTNTANALAGLIGGTYSAATGFSLGSTTPDQVQAKAAGSLAPTPGTPASAGPPAVAATPAGPSAFDGLLNTVSTQLNQAGADSQFLDATITFNSAKIDSLNSGLGALIDADLSKESANLQALQIRQQLGTQSLSLANQAPQALLSLFK